MNFQHALLGLATVIGLSSFGASGAAAQSPEELFAVLSGGNEVSTGGAANAGDQDGHGGVTVTFDGPALTTLCIGVVVDNIAKPTLMHIHQNVAGQNGPIVVTFNPPAAGNPGTRGQCVTNVDPALSAAIRSNPAGFYVNIHNTPFGGGAVRGQLF